MKYGLVVFIKISKIMDLFDRTDAIKQRIDAINTDNIPSFISHIVEQMLLNLHCQIDEIIAKNEKHYEVVLSLKSINNLLDAMVKIESAMNELESVIYKVKDI